MSVAVDGVLYESEVYAASNVSQHIAHQPSTSPSLISGASSRRHKGRRKWGGTAVLVLVGIRLGIDGVNPVYHESVKVIHSPFDRHVLDAHSDICRNCSRSLNRLVLPVADPHRHTISWAIRLSSFSTLILITPDLVFPFNPCLI